MAMKGFQRKWRRLVFVLVGVMAALPMQAQIDDKYKDYREVYRDTVTMDPLDYVLLQKDTLVDPYRVVTNSFGKNWFVFGTGGAHTFRGDYSNLGPFKGTISPDWSIGFGKWFMPWLALKVEFLQSNSRGYTAYKTGHYGYEDVAGKDYRLMKTPWWDHGASAMLNLTRIYYGYEGYGSREHMNQWMLNGGIGGVHHMGYNHAYGSDNELSGHVELQYSRFFTPEKRVSLDIKARALVYQTNFDLEYGQVDAAAHKFDTNLGLHVGFTVYLGKKGTTGWNRVMTTVYRDTYREREIKVMKVKEEEALIEREKPIRNGTLTFFVFYPNNYSGRNDAPQISTSSVNAIDYLAGGIFTQKQYADADKVAARILAGQSLNGLTTIDLPTERADRDFAVNYVPRGYEMLEGTPISLSLDYDTMNEFREKSGYYYAPIFDGMNVWKYRIDDATLGQHLLSSANYQETNSYGLNAHAGLGTVTRFMEVGEDDELVSFADVYAALNSNEGYVSQFTDEAAVAHVRKILNKGIVVLIQVEGLATSQDNYSGADANRVGTERNAALAENRANTVISWLTGHKELKDVKSQIYLVNNQDGIRTVNDPSTRGLNAKLNRCVKVRIRYMIQED